MDLSAAGDLLSLLQSIRRLVSDCRTEVLFALVGVPDSINCLNVLQITD